MRRLAAPSDRRTRAPHGRQRSGGPAARRRRLAREIRRCRPEALAIGGFELPWPGGFLNQADHRAVGLAACNAARDAGNRWIFRELLGEGSEPWGGVRYIFVSGAHQPT